MSEPDAIVFVVDDDATVRDALGRLMRSVDLHCELFSSAEEFLQRERVDAPSCLIVAVRLPGKSGLEFQRELTEKRIHIPIVFLTAYGDIAMSVTAMKAGAVDFLTKPFREQDLLDAIHPALGRSRATRRQEAELASLRERFESLTPREREILPLVVSGLLNKQIAAEIGISVAAVKVHRSQLIRKMGANSLPGLVRMADKLGIPEEASQIHGPPK